MGRMIGLGAFVLQQRCLLRPEGEVKQRHIYAVNKFGQEGSLVWLRNGDEGTYDTSGAFVQMATGLGTHTWTQLRLNWN